jgi:hypothetical protein
MGIPFRYLATHGLYLISIDDWLDITYLVIPHKIRHIISWHISSTDGGTKKTDWDIFTASKTPDDEDFLGNHLGIIFCRLDIRPAYRSPR